jgi:predicted Na+-dependent transporter
MASCVAVPLAIGTVRKSGGNLAYSASLKLVTAACAVITTPVTLAIFANAFGFEAQVRPLVVALLVFFLVVLPIGAGTLVRERIPRLAGLGRFASRVATPILVPMLVLLLIVGFRGILETTLYGYLAIVLAVVSSFVVVHLVAPKHPAMRISLAMEAGVRNIGLSAAVIILNSRDADPLALLFPAVIVVMIANVLYGKWQRGKAAATDAQRPAAGGPPTPVVEGR